MTAIFKREIRSYFNSPIGYVCVAILMALYGLFYFMVMARGSSAYISNYVYGSMFNFSMLVIPVITMKSMTDDQKNKTDQILLTAPVGVTSIVMGKFLACFFVFFIASTLGLLPAVAMNFFAAPSWGEIIGNYLGTLLYGGAMISIGVFISSLTISQIIAAIGTFAVSVFLMYVDSLAASVNNAAVATLVSWISFSNRYQTFTQGLFSTASTLFFLSVMAIFVFLTARRLESRRWS